jgi:hypothetical protein
MAKFNQVQLNGLDRCPHCGVASPQLPKKWFPEHAMPRGDGHPLNRWAAYACTNCGGVVLAKGKPGDLHVNAEIEEIIPAPRTAHEDLPERARIYLQQAYNTLHAPDAAAMVAGSAVDAMLKHLGYKDGSLYARIDEAKANGILTAGMAAWAHSVRLGSNNPRHADDNDPHTTSDQAKQAVEFAEGLGYFLFVLTAKIERGISAAQQAG